jgi:mRNA interferase MazF
MTRLSCKICRGQVWLYDPDPVVGREQGKQRPGVIISHDVLNQSYSQLVIMLPITSKNQRISSHIKITPPEGGLSKVSYVICEQIRCISRKRLIRLYGYLKSKTILDIENWLCRLLSLNN